MNDDIALVQRCLVGDAAGVRAFMQKYHGMIYGLCWRMLRHREDAEDVTQESLARIFRYLDQWEPTKPLRPWIMAITANRCRTRLSRQRNRAHLTGEWQDYAVEEAEGIDLAEELQRGIDQLRENYRECFILFYQQDLSVQEISELMECPPGTVKTWLHRARRQIAETLRERGVVSEDGYELHRP